MAETPSLKISLLTPERTVLEEVVDKVVLPLWDGELGVYPKHAPLLGKLGHGELRAHRGDQVFRFYVGGGFVEIADDQVTVLSDSAIPAKELDAETARTNVQAIRTRPARGDEELEQRLADLDVAFAKLRVAKTKSS